MIRIRHLAALLAATPAFLPLPAHAQSVGRTLVAVGEVVAVRDARETPLHTGSEVRLGDTLRVGRDSNAQIRLNDESIIALRSDTEFRIEGFRFRNDPASDNALFRLVRGGLRTVTGLIGRVNHDAYRLETPVGYVGIRGTHYTLVQCVGQCLNKDGSVAPGGAYGGVSDGRIGVGNQSGEKVFGRDEYFYVASIASPPQSLIAPPSFLSDRLEGQVRSSRKQQAAEAPAQAPAKSGTSSDGRTSTAEPVATAAAPAAAEARTVYVATEQRSGEGGLVAVQPTFPTSGRIFFSWNPGGTIRDSAGNTGTLLSNGGIAVDYGQRRVFAALNVTVGGVEWNVGTPDGIPLVVSGSGATFSGTFNQSDFAEDSIGHCSQCGQTGQLGNDFRIASMTLSGTFTSGSTATVNATFNSDTLNRTVTVSGVSNVPTPLVLERMAAMTMRNGSQTGAMSTVEPAFLNNNASFDAGNELQSLRGIAGPWIAERGSSAHQLLGNRSDAGDLTWGMWTGAGATLRSADYVTYTSGPTDAEHYIHGKVTSALPTSLGSSVNYSPVGGVVNGGTGRFNGGTINLDFTQQRVDLINLSASRAEGETYVMNGTSSISRVTPSFDGKFTSVTCSGGAACTPNLGGGYGGFLAGTNGEGIGLSFNAGNGLQGVSGVQAFKR